MAGEAPGAVGDTLGEAPGGVGDASGRRLWGGPRSCRRRRGGGPGRGWGASGLVVGGPRRLVRKKPPSAAVVRSSVVPPAPCPLQKGWGQQQSQRAARHLSSAELLKGSALLSSARFSQCSHTLFIRLFFSLPCLWREDEQGMMWRMTGLKRGSAGTAGMGRAQ